MKIIEEKKYVFNNKLDRIELDDISINSFSVVHVETMLSFLKARGLKFNVYQNSFKYEWIFEFENLSLRFKSAKEFCNFLLPVFVSERNKQRSEYYRKRYDNERLKLDVQNSLVCQLGGNGE